MSTSSEALRPGISWNATRAASVLLVVIVAVIALVFWPSFSSSGSSSGSSPGTERPAVQPSTGLAAPHQPIVVNGEVCVQCSP
jgi:hypothetical protein